MATGIPKTQWNGLATTQETLTNDPNMQLVYAGKITEKAILATEPSKVSLVWQPDSLQTPNALYYGDNLPILSALMHDDAIRGKVKLVYIDPPFSTSSVFQSRNQQAAYQDVLVGSSFIEFLRRRFVLLRELLADDGSIYVHLDEHMAFAIKMIMDEIFGQHQFRNWITRRKCSHKNYTRKTYGNISDYILFYTKSDNYIWNRPLEEWTPERIKKEYPCIEEKTGRRYKKVPIHAPGVRNGATGEEWRGMLPPPGKHWMYTPARLDEMDTRGEIYWSATGNPRRKIYLDNSAGVPVQDIWFDFRDTRNQNVHITGYPTEKNPDMMARIIHASSNPDDLVLDCFAGSGTTMAVASQLGRNWIGIDNSNEAIQTILRRFAQGTNRMGDFVNTPTAHTRNGNRHIEQLGFGVDETQQETHTQERFLINDFRLYISDEMAKERETLLSLMQTMFC